jgi:hypothetical protein
MSLPPTPLHQTLPGTFAKREDAVAAIRGLEVTVRFEQQVGSSIIVTCTSPRCKHAKGFVCRHACVVGAHDFPMCGKLIQRDNGAWWLRNMVRRMERGLKGRSGEG